nr:hypothetical protein [Tanacetum cinerariifolium]
IEFPLAEEVPTASEEGCHCQKKREATAMKIALLSKSRRNLYQMDVKSVFLYSTIDEEVYVMQPFGFQDPEFPAKVYKVEKAMYGLHQDPRAWYGTLSKYLLKNGFQRGIIDQTLFIRRQRGDFILVQVYVDDIIFGSLNPQLCREFEALMHEKFQMSVMGELNFFLGLQVLQKEDGIFLSQDKYIGDILKKFGYSEVRSSNTPMDKENPWGKDRTGKMHQVTPKECHLHAVKRIFRYLKGHPKLGLWYPKESPFDLIIVATSTTEAEYVAAASCYGQVLWIQNQLLDYGLSMPCETLSREFSTSILCFNTIMARLQFYDYHNMVAILEKSEHNVDIHPMVDFIEASPLRYALTVKPTVYVSHIRQFWSTARIETMEEETKILATVDGILRIVTESSLRINLKLKDEDGISSLPDTELFENLTLMGYNISPNQKFTFQKGQFSHQWKYLIHTIMQCLSPKSTGFNEFNSNIATALICLATNRTYNFSKMIFDGLEIVKLLEDRDGVAAVRSGDDALIKGRILDEREAAVERVSNDSEEMKTVLTSIDAATVLAGGIADVPTGKSDTLKKQKVQEQIDAQVARELEEQLEREDQKRSEQIARDAEIARIHVEEELQIMIDGLDRNNETIAKYLQEYHQFALKLPIERRIELISDLVKSNLGWKVKDFRGTTFEEVEAKFNSVWKQIKDFIPMGSKEEAKRIKRKGLSLEQESVKKFKPSEEVTKEAKSPNEVPEKKIKDMMHLVPIEEVYVEALQFKHPIIN